MKHTLVIKNMVCPRCIASVRQVFNGLSISISEITLGKVMTIDAITTIQKTELQEQLKTIGFELLDDRQSQIINQIKSIVIQQIHYPSSTLHTNFSTLLTDQLHYDYAYLSRLFSTVTGRTIEQFIIIQKVERVKELLIYNEFNISEIAFQMNYSSSAHLSAQFKKVTGMSPSVFRKLQTHERQFLDKL